MSFTLIMAVTAAVAATMGYMAARRKGDGGEEREETDKKDAPPPSSKRKKAEQKGKPDPKGKAAPDPKAAFAGLPLSLGDVVSDHADERQDDDHDASQDCDDPNVLHGDPPRAQPSSELHAAPSASCL